MMKIVRIFPRKTQATPDDELVRIGSPGLFPPEADEYHISVTFTYDLPIAEKLEQEWRMIGKTRIGGPALGDPGGDFVPGLYLKKGYVITSRGCPHRCYYCYVPKREGPIREIPITEGHRIQDNNLLACSRSHIEKVFDMLSRQRDKARFQGGLEASLIKPWIADRLLWLKPESIYLAYDKPKDREPLAQAVQILRNAGFRKTSHSISAYILIGFPGDSFDKAEDRMNFVLTLGVIPFAMLYRDDQGKRDPAWMSFQKLWCRPQIIGSRLREMAD